MFDAFHLPHLREFRNDSSCLPSEQSLNKIVYQVDSHELNSWMNHPFESTKGYIPEILEPCTIDFTTFLHFQCFFWLVVSQHLPQIFPLLVVSLSAESIAACLQVHGAEGLQWGMVCCIHYTHLYTIGSTTWIRSAEDTFCLISESTVKMHFVGCSDDWSMLKQGCKKKLLELVGTTDAGDFHDCRFMRRLRILGCGRQEMPSGHVSSPLRVIFKSFNNIKSI